jgi:hypothetical protein
VIAESADGGTNALLLSPPDAIPFGFGPRSAAIHEAAARTTGLTAKRLRLPFLSRDLDTPSDLRTLGRNPELGEAVQLSAFALPGIPEVREGDDLAELIASALSLKARALETGDIVVVAQEIVSKSERRLRHRSDFIPSPKALEIAAAIGKDPRKIEAILSESIEVLRAKRMGPDGLLITRHRNGWICANAGIDESNLESSMQDVLLLLPEDADRSARLIRAELEKRYGGRRRSLLKQMRACSLPYLKYLVPAGEIVKIRRLGGRFSQCEVATGVVSPRRRAWCWPVRSFKIAATKVTFRLEMAVQELGRGSAP